MAIFRRGTPLTGASNAGGVTGVGTNRDSRPISGFGSMTAGVRATIATVDRAVYRTDGDASVSAACSMDDHDEEKRTQQNLIVRSGKSEAEVTNNRRLYSTCCTIEANY